MLQDPSPTDSISTKPSKAVLVFVDAVLTSMKLKPKFTSHPQKSSQGNISTKKTVDLLSVCPMTPPDYHFIYSLYCVCISQVPTQLLQLLSRHPHQALLAGPTQTQAEPLQPIEGVKVHEITITAQNKQVLLQHFCEGFVEVLHFVRPSYVPCPVHACRTVHVDVGGLGAMQKAVQFAEESVQPVEGNPVVVL